jgi:hypothetical protein
MAGGLAVTCALVCIFYPPVLLSMASLMILGVAPLAFLSLVSAPLAVLAVSVLAGGAAFLMLMMASVLIGQTCVAGIQIYDRLKENMPPALPPSNENSTTQQLRSRQEEEPVPDFDYAASGPSFQKKFDLIATLTGHGTSPRPGNDNSPNPAQI